MAHFYTNRRSLMRLISALVTVLGGNLWLAGCGSTGLENETFFIVSMLGAFEEPTGATGDSEPKYQSYEVQNLSLTVAETGEVMDLYEGDPKTVRIIGRSQIIH